MTHRTRNVQLKINLTEEEKTLFHKKMKMANCKTMNHFLRKVVSESNIYVVDLQPFREIQGLLSRYANSVNQIAKRVNSIIKFVTKVISYARTKYIGIGKLRQDE